MSENQNYLTEEKLGKILKSIYPSKQIVGQYKYENKRADYGIEFMPDEIDMLPPKVSIKYAEYLEKIDCLYHEGCENEDCEGENCTIEQDEKIVLLIEFDGHYHYTKNSQAAFEHPKGDWSRLDDTVFLLRIPYWIQLDETMTKKWFGIEKDFSNEFPQGFISKYAYLPGNFCVAGEKRFKTEMLSLPINVAMSVTKSLLDKTGYPNKFKEKAMAEVGTMDLWSFLISNFCPEFQKIVDQMRKLSPDPGKFYKHFTPSLYYILYSNPIIHSLYLHEYIRAVDKKEMIESLTAYCEWHDLNIKIFSFTNLF